jgi:hypothetical protein
MEHDRMVHPRRLHRIADMDDSRINSLDLLHVPSLFRRLLLVRPILHIGHDHPRNRLRPEILRP